MEIAAEHQVKEVNGQTRPPQEMSNEAKWCLPLLMAVASRCLASCLSYPVLCHW